MPPWGAALMVLLVRALALIVFVTISVTVTVAIFKAWFAIASCTRGLDRRQTRSWPTLHRLIERDDTDIYVSLSHRKMERL